MKRRTPKNILKFMEHRAEGAEMTEAYHWVCGANEIDGINGLDDGESTPFCYRCCEEMVAKIYDQRPWTARNAGICVDGGGSVVAHSFAFCNACGVRLQVSFSDRGFRETFAEFITHDFVNASPDTWDMFGELLMHIWADNVSVYDPHPDEARFNHDHDRVKKWRIVAKIVRKVQRAQRKQS